MKLRQLLPYLLFLTLVCVFLWRPIFKGEALLPGEYLAQMSPWKSVMKAPNPPPQWNPLQWDAIAQFYPWRVFYAQSMRSGHLPIWNPYQFGGTPFLANGQSAVLYPPNLLLLIFDPITAFTVFAALHLFLAQVFMYWLLRRLGVSEFGGIVGAICFAFSAFMVLWLELPTLISAAVWLPLVLFLVHRSVARKSVFDAMLAGLALSMSFLAGHLQIALYVALAAVLWWLWMFAQTWREQGRAEMVQRIALPFAACFLIAGLVASAQLLPSMELAKQSPRVSVPSAEGYKWFTANAVQPYRLVTAFSPDFYGNPSRNSYFLVGMFDGHAGSAADYMEYGMYIGIFPLLLALVGVGTSWRQKNARYFWALAVIALLSAVGTIFNVPFYYLLPGVSAFGGPNRVLLLYLFGIAGLAGFGADYLLKRSDETVKLAGKDRQLSKLLLFASVVALDFLLLSSAQTANDFCRGLGVTVNAADTSTIAFGLSTMAFLLCGAHLMGLMSRKSFGVIALLFIVGDLFAFGMNYNPTCSRDKVYPRTALTDVLTRLEPNARVAVVNPRWSLAKTPDAVLPPNAGMVYGFRDLQGYDSLYRKTYKDSFSEIQGIDASPPENGNMVLVRRYTPQVSEMADYVVSKEAVPGLIRMGTWDGVSVFKSSHKATEIPGRTENMPVSCRMGFLCAFIGLVIFAVTGVATSMKNRVVKAV